MQILIKYALLSLLLLILAACGGQSGQAQPLLIDDIIASPLRATFDIQGHRGARGLKPENTLPAFETALDLGVNTLELDLHLSKDGNIVIWHDDELKPDKCQIAEKKAISQLSAQQLSQVRCDKNPDKARFPQQSNSPTPLAGNHYTVLRLSELFEFVMRYSQSDKKSNAQKLNALRVHFNIETKRKRNKPAAINDGFDGVNAGPFELKILQLIEQYGLQDRVMIQSFYYPSLWAIHAINPNIQLAALSSKQQPDIGVLSQSGASVWSPKASTLTPFLIKKAHALNLKVIPWTINDEAQMRHFIKLQVDGIITDRPDLLLSLEL